MLADPVLGLASGAVELFIDGEVVRKPLKEVTKLAQITIAADNRLEEAKRLLR